MSEREQILFGNYFSDVRAAVVVDQTPRTLRAWRQRGIGPSWIKVGKKIFYSEAALRTWIASLEQKSARERRAAR